MATRDVVENLASEYLATSLRACLDAAAEPTRLDASLRQSVLYAAFAAEAYANAFLGLACTQEHRQAIDRISTPDKFLAGPKLAGANSPFSRGSDPLQALIALFKRRNELVHHRPGIVKREIDPRTGALKPRDRPFTVVRFAIGVAAAAEILDECLDILGVESALAVAWDWGDEIDELPKRQIESWFVGEPGLVALEEREYLEQLARTMESGEARPLTAAPASLLGLNDRGVH